MNHLAPVGKTWLVLASLMLVVCWRSTAEARYGDDTEVLIEGGVAFPYGDLGDDYTLLYYSDSNLNKGLGAETGYEVGGRLRYYFTPEWALAPSFQFVDFGDFTGYDQSLGNFEVRTSILRYGMDLQYFIPTYGQGFQPYLSAGLALCRDRYEDRLEQDISYFQTSINTLGVGLGGGLRVGDFEWSLIYNINRFSTVRLTGTPLKEDFNWDYLILRAGFAFPTR